VKHDRDAATLASIEQRLEAREEIRDLVARYGVAIDDRDWETLASLYAPDAVFDSTGPAAHGREAVVDYVRCCTADYSASYHYPHSHEIIVDDAGQATGLVCAHADLVIDGEAVWIALRYDDQYRCIDGRWHFHQRVTSMLYILKLSELPTGVADGMRLRWPGEAPQCAHLGADVNRRWPDTGS